MEAQGSQWDEEVKRWDGEVKGEGPGSNGRRRWNQDVAVGWEVEGKGSSGMERFEGEG